MAQTTTINSWTDYEQTVYIAVKVTRKDLIEWDATTVNTFYQKIGELREFLYEQGATGNTISKAV